jgi:hypothetical protein
LPGCIWRRLRPASQCRRLLWGELLFPIHFPPRLGLRLFQGSLSVFLGFFRLSGFFHPFFSPFRLLL